MPITDGQRLFEALAPRCDGMAVLYMSGHTDEVITSRRVLEEDVGFLQKPFTVQVLLTAVRDTIDRLQRNNSQQKYRIRVFGQSSAIGRFLPLSL